MIQRLFAPLLACGFLFSIHGVAEVKMPYLVSYRVTSENLSAFTEPRVQRAEHLQRLRKLVLSQEERMLVNMKSLKSEDLQSLWLIGASIVNLSPTQLNDIRQIAKTTAGIQKIEPLDFKVQLASVEVLASNDVTTGLKRIKYPEFRDLHPLAKGRGARVGIVDTGIDAGHRDLLGKTLAFKDFISRRTAPYDDNGHGTHVAGIIAGGSASGKQIGVAPEAQLYVAKAFSRYGGSDEASLLLALQWMADPDQNPSTDDAAMIVSNSWNSDRPIRGVAPVDDPFCRVVDGLHSLGIIVVFAAGNDGPDSSSIKTPGACPNALTVAATDNADVVTEMSSRGPALWRSLLVAKPEISAPGYRVESSWPGNDYKKMSGTSMATPYVAGSLALIAVDVANSSRAKEILLKSGSDLGAPGFDKESGYGLLNLQSLGAP